MHSMVVRIHAHGGPEVLQVEETDVGPPGAGQVRLQQTAIGLNFADIYQRQGEPGPHDAAPFPIVLGAQGAGVVESVGPGVADVVPGDRVAYVHPGAYQSVRLAPAERMVRLPGDVSDEQAAATLLRGMTAEYLLHRLYRVRPGDVVLVHAAAGGMGVLLCQWARALGATVIGTVGSAEKAAVAAAHGCHHVIDYRRSSFVEAVRDLTTGGGVHVVYDSVGRDTFMGSLDCLRPMGMAINYGTASGQVEPFPLQRLHSKSLIVTRPTLRTYIASRADLEASSARLFEAARGGMLRLEVGSRYRLADIRSAHDDLESRRTIGAPILVP